jgi:hypothetical protein
MTDAPIACTLTADDMTARAALIDALAADGLLERTPTDAGVRLRLRDTPEIERRIRELVAAESACCPFLDLDLSRDRDGIVLHVGGPDAARPLIDRFFAAA